MFLFLRRKITILKAIHNSVRGFATLKGPVSAPKNYNFESNSQLENSLLAVDNPVSAPKNYNFESNSQQAAMEEAAPEACFCAEKLQF